MDNKQIIEKYGKERKEKDSALNNILILSAILGSIVIILLLSKVEFTIALLVVCEFVTFIMIVKLLLKAKNVVYKSDNKYIVEKWDIIAKNKLDSNFVDLNMHRKAFELETAYFVKVDGRYLEITQPVYEELKKAKKADNKVYLVLTEEEYSKLNNEYTMKDTEVA